MALSLATVKAALRLDYTEDDAELSRLILAAEAWVENYCGIRLASATRTMSLLAWRRTAFAEYPYSSVTSVTYTDTADVVQTLTAGSDYWVDTTQPMACIEFTVAPALKVGTLITVTYVAGYAAYPNEVAQAVISLVGLWYSNPEAAQPTALSSVPLGGQFMLEHLRVKGPFR